MADGEKRPRRRRGKKAEDPTPEYQPTEIEALGHNITTIGIAQMKLLQAIYAEQRAYSFFLLSEQIGGDDGVRIFTEARQLQDQSKDLVRGAWHDVFGESAVEPQEETDGEPEVQGG